MIRTGHSRGARITVNIRKSKEYHSLPKEVKQEKYTQYKKRINKRCNCGKLLNPRNESGLCKNCSMKKIWKKRRETGGK